MFTGIIHNIGLLKTMTENRIAVLAPPVARELKKGSSIAVDGVCLTVTAVKNGAFTADMMPETRRATNLKTKKPGDPVNLELAIRADGRFEGHFVTGHVDAAGTVEKIETKGNAKILTVKIPGGLARYIAPKGSITLNGVSLTVISAGKNRFTVGIIPHTWNATNLGVLKKGDPINIETDLLAKYLLNKL